jgi:CMP-N,N'-diacetyllegionaminic acid synthase
VKDCLFIIPARAGSKGIPGKNHKILGAFPLIQYSINYARHFVSDSQICISTDDAAILELAKQLNLAVPFVRPKELSGDTASANDVIQHAINYYKSIGQFFTTVVYLQPTSPFRLKKHLSEAYQYYTNEQADMVVSVCESHLNPYFSLFEENEQGYLKRSKTLPNGIDRRQDAPKVYTYNGSIYMISIKALQSKPLHQLEKIKKYIMSEDYLIDIDTMKDWYYVEFLLTKNLVIYE